MKTCKVVIRCPAKSPRTYEIRNGLGFQALAAKYKDTALEFGCRNADCGICVLRVVAGMDNLYPRNTKESDFLQAMRADPDERLACQARIKGDICVELSDC
ncbi:MAG: 2Fe-2S iron-sulfur cluster-binding protein [Pseudomonadota bacterium]|nr:2Fe-2S iron-sulfur cluster-binding protein [Pseudomonadota bacterium]